MAIAAIKEDLATSRQELYEIGAGGTAIQKMRRPRHPAVISLSEMTRLRTAGQVIFGHIQRDTEPASEPELALFASIPRTRREGDA